jgi:hypothetical protein
MLTTLFCVIVVYKGKNKKIPDTLLGQCHSVKMTDTLQNIQSVSEGKVNILGGHSVDHSRQKCICMGPILNSSEIKLFDCTFPKLLI